MIESSQMHLLQYRKPRFKDKRKLISNVIGMDSEAYTDGVPFVIADSTGHLYDPHNVISEVLDKHPDSNIMLYNMKYDGGAILRFLPREVMHSLWLNGKAVHKDIKLEYIPHKLLRVKRGKTTVSFWDIAQFYKSSLDNAAKRYLNDSKTDPGTKRFTRSMTQNKSFLKKVQDYCIKDADLTRRLGEYLISKLDEFGIEVPALYSCAAIAYRYFCAHSKPNDVWKWWKGDKKLIALACDSYEGGKFEVTARGVFTGHEYDISSAYPYEIANLVDLKNATVRHSRDFQPDAVYGYIRCKIRAPEDIHLPCGVKTKTGARFYPTGNLELTITKNEYLYCKEIGCDITILEAAWVFVKQRRRLYRKVILPLFDLKSKYKGKDPMLYSVTKIVQNSFYGKLCQTVDQPDGSIIAGAAWHPLHASEITANTRIKVTRIQNTLKDRCIAVHTDSAFTLDPLPQSMLSESLGEFGHVVSGSGIMIACGLYNIGDTNKFRGFETPRPWRDILSEFPRRKIISIPTLHVESWVECMAKNHPTSVINRFVKEERIQKLNCDEKRIWPKDLYAKDFLTTLQFSKPKYF